MIEIFVLIAPLIFIWGCLLFIKVKKKSEMNKSIVFIAISLSLSLLQVIVMNDLINLMLFSVQIIIIIILTKILIKPFIPEKIIESQSNDQYNFNEHPD